MAPILEIGKVESARRLIRAELIPIFSHYVTRSISSQTLDGTLVHRMVTLRITLPVPIYTPGWTGCTVRVKCLAQEHNRMSLARVWTQTIHSGVKCTNHEVTVPPTICFPLLSDLPANIMPVITSFSIGKLHWQLMLSDNPAFLLLFPDFVLTFIIYIYFIHIWNTTGRLQSSIFFQEFQTAKKPQIQQLYHSDLNSSTCQWLLKSSLS